MNTKNMQSANSLFKFMNELKYLKDILNNKALIPRYCDEDITYLNWTYKFLSFPMVCFCDIRLSKVIDHIAFYGQYGIGLSKKWGKEKGIQALQYINSNSELTIKLNSIFSYAIEDDGDNNSYQSFLLYTLLFQKPLEGTMTYRNEMGEATIVNKVFQDEQEWRYINTSFRNIVGDQGLIIRENNITSKKHSIKKDAYNNEIIQHEECWLKFEYKDINYLLVNTQIEKDELMKFIFNDLKIALTEKLNLISKILTVNNIMEDI